MTTVTLKFRLLLFPAILLFSSFAAHAQAPVIEWQKCLGGSYTDAARCIQPTADSGFIVTGYTFSNDGDVTGYHSGPDTMADGWLVKLDKNGAIQWERTLGGSGDDMTWTVRITRDKGYMVSGFSESTDGDAAGSGLHATSSFFGVPPDYWMVKLDSLGHIEWQKCIGSFLSDFAFDIQQTMDDGYIITGFVEAGDGDVTSFKGLYDMWTAKLDASGNIQWQKCLGGSSADWGIAVQQGKDGGYIVSGMTQSDDSDVTGFHGEPEFTGDIWLVRFDTGGNVLWKKTLGGTGTEYGRAVLATDDGGFLVAGESNSTDGDVTGNHGGDDIWVVKLNEGGDIEWQHSYGGSADETVLGMQQAPDGNYIVVGTTSSADGDVTGLHTSSTDSATQDVWLLKINDSGAIMWQKTMGGSGQDMGAYVMPTLDYGYIVCGITNSSDGDVSGGHGSDDFWVVKLTTDTVTTTTAVAQHAAQDVIAVYPTVTDGVVHISLPQSYEHASFTLYNMLGQPLATTIYGSATQRTMQIANVPAGIYTLCIGNAQRIKTYSIVYRP